MDFLLVDGMAGSKRGRAEEAGCSSRVMSSNGACVGVSASSLIFSDFMEGGVLVLGGVFGSAFLYLGSGFGIIKGNISSCLGG